MTMISNRLRKDERGAGAVEFALVAPVLFGIIIGISQLAILFFANAGLQNAVGEGARFATIFPRPSDADIRAVMTTTRFGMNPANIPAPPTITPGTDTATGWEYRDISMSYSVSLDFLFVDVAPFTMTKTRRVFVQDTAPAT